MEEHATTTGPLGPALATAISDHNAALRRLEEAEAALAAAQQEVGGTRARLAALAAGARVTGAKALLVVPDGAADEDVRG
jgi:hypothetical protein